MDADADNHHELIKRAQSGDVDAFAELVEAHQGLVFNVVMRSLNNRETAQDITQEVFIQVWKTIANFDDRAKFSTWLYRIAMNALISHLRFTRAQKRGGEKADLSFDHNEEHRLDPSHDRRREGSEASSGDAEMERSET
ncbi:MAG: sigma-70 family RNA polymerase sigma factor, partial [Planctomycetes bacterium]|nr:sigma-70 family RNA polymerase sigma factor [Planctomycetota bacterium]